MFGLETEHFHKTKHMKTFGDIRKGDKLYVVNTGTAIPGGVEIIEHEALSDYSDSLKYNSITLHGVMIHNPFGNDMPLCFTKEDTHTGMYFTTLEEAKKKAVETIDLKLEEFQASIQNKLNEVFELHEQMMIAKLKRQSFIHEVKNPWE